MFKFQTFPESTDDRVVRKHANQGLYFGMKSKPLPLSAWSGAPGSYLALWPAYSLLLSPWLHVALSSRPLPGLFFASPPEAPKAQKQESYEVFAETNQITRAI